MPRDPIFAHLAGRMLPPVFQQRGLDGRVPFAATWFRFHVTGCPRGLFSAERVRPCLRTEIAVLA